MKNIFLFITVIGSFLNGSQINHIPFGIKSNCSQVLIREAYISCFNYKTRNPDWVAYVSFSELGKKSMKRINSFKQDIEIPINYRATLKDYKGSSYQRGHLMENALADYNRNAQRESFLLSNIVPQLAEHNTGVWKYLEKKVRDILYKEQFLSIITGVAYKPNYKKIKNRVAVPDYFYKVIFAPNSEKMYAFLIPHKKIRTRDFRKYQVSVDMIEDLTDTNFFYKLVDKFENRLESEINKI